jgi:hypothetical protein
MLKNIFLFFSVMLLLVACTGDKVAKGIIPRDKMTNLLIDIHIVDGGIYGFISQNPDSLYKYGVGRYTAVFKRYHVDTAEFRKSLKYYARRPAELTLIYTDVMANLQGRIDSLNKSMYNKPQRKNNGLRPTP